MSKTKDKRPKATFTIDVFVPDGVSWKFNGKKEHMLTVIGALDVAKQWMRDELMTGEMNVKVNGEPSRMYDRAEEDKSEQDTESVERQPEGTYHVLQELSRDDAEKVYYEAINILRKRLSVIIASPQEQKFHVPVATLLQL